MLAASDPLHPPIFHILYRAHQSSMVVTSEHALPHLAEGAAYSGHHHRRKHCCRSSRSRQKRACKHKGWLGGSRRARGQLIPVQEQQGRNKGRLERERKERVAKKSCIWARHQEQRDLERRKQRRRGRPARRAARAHARVVRSTARAAARSKELVVATWNVRTMSERGTNRPGHAEDILMFAAKYECDFIAIQETRRDERTTIQAPAAGYVVHCSGHCDGDGGKPGILGVGLAVRESIARALGPDGIVPEHISARLLKVRGIFKHRAATTFVVGYAPTETAATCHKSKSGRNFAALLLRCLPATT